MSRLALLTFCILQIILTTHALGKYSVIGPGTLHSKSKYNVAVAVYQNTEPAQIKVGIVGPSYNEVKTVQLNADELKNIEFDVPALEKGDYNLTAEGLSGIVFKNTTKLNYDDFNPYVKIQTDKGTYKPGDVVNFRIIFLDENLRPAVPKKDAIAWIEDQKRNRIKEYRDIEVVKGVYTDTFKISEYPVLGTWYFMVSNGQDYPTTAYFEVDKYVLPKFVVKVEATDNVAVQDGDMQIVVRSNYTYDKPFNGKVTILTNVGTYYYSEDGENQPPKLIRTANMVNGKAKIDLNVKEYEPYLKQKRSTYYMEITATVEENFTGVKINGSTSSNLYPYRYHMRCVEYETCSIYHADKEQDVVFKIMHVNNAEVKDTKSVVKLTYTEATSKNYWYGGSTTAEPVEPKIDGKTFVFESHMNASGVVIFKVKLPELEEFEHFQHFFKSKLEYAGEDHEMYQINPYRKPKVVEPQPDPEPNKEPKDYLNLDAHYEKDKWSVAIGDTITLTINSSVPLKYFISNIIARGNLLQSERVVLPQPVEVHNFTIKTTFLMAPSSSVYIHYVDEKGEYHYAETSLRIEVKLQNEIEITAPEQVNPGEEVALRIKTAPNSFVGLLAVDQSVLLLNENNDLQHDSFNWQLSRYGTYTPHQGGFSYYPGTHSGVVTLTNGDYFYNWTVPEYYHAGPLNRVGISADGLRPTTFAAAPAQAESDAVGGSSGGGAVEVRVRKNFDETWIFANIENTETAEFTWTKQIPDTITSWMLSGFSVNPEKGLGVTKERTKVITFQKFFLSVRLPYSVKRGEVFNVPALVFNYLDKALDVTVTLDNTDGEYEFTDVSNEVINEEKRTKTVRVAGNSAAGVSFMVRPKIVGNMMLKFTATSPIAGDAVHRTLRVLPEGITEYANRAYFVNLKDEHEFKESFELALPDEIVPDSEHIEFSVIGDLLGPLLSNPSQLLRLPTGCAEQTTSSLIPNYLALRYLKISKKLTPHLESQSKRNLEDGYQRLLRYRNDDGSFSSFGPWLWARSEKPLNGSTWLTAYIANALSEAAQHVVIDSDVIQKSVEFLASKQADNGSFVESGDIFYASQNHHLTLTATVVSALLKNSTLAKQHQSKIDKALDYIVDNLDKTESLHAKAFGTYTLHQAGHKKAGELLAGLKSLAKTDEDRMWWSEKVKPSALWWRWVYSNDVETTSYILLTLLDAEGETSQSVLPIVKWLVAQRNSYGGFASTRDTVVGLRALIKFAEKSGYEPAVMDISFTAKGGPQESKDSIKLTEDNGLLMHTRDLPQKTHGVDFHATGKGAALVQVSYQYNIREKEKKPSFSINTIVNKETPELKLELDVCVEYVDEGKSSNMAVLEVSLPSGYTADDTAFEDIEKVDRVRLVETKLDDTQVVVYFESLPKGEAKCVTIGAFRTFAVAMQKPSPAAIYDYYDTSKKATSYYEVQSKLCDICDGDEECQKACK